MAQAVAYASLTQISLEDEDARWNAFYEAVPDGEKPEDIEALEKLIRAQAVVIEIKDRITHEGLRYVELLGVTPAVDRPGQEMHQGERFIWISLARGEDFVEACMADESGLQDFEEIQLA